jgi:hypothetical protein
MPSHYLALAAPGPIPLAVRGKSAAFLRPSGPQEKHI